MIGLILAIYIINSTVNTLFFKKNQRSALDTLLSIGFFGMTINSVAFGVSTLFVVNPFLGLTWSIAGISIARGVLIVAGLFLVTKAFKILPVSIMSPLSMVIIVPLLLLSWWIFGDTVDTLVLILVAVMLVVCVGLVVVEGYKKDTKAKTTASKNNSIKIEPLIENQNDALGTSTKDTTVPIKNKRKLKGYWLGIIYFVTAMMCFLATQIFTRILADSGIPPFTITFFNSSVIFATVLVAFAALRKNPIKTLTENCKSPLQFGIAITDSMWLFLYLPLVTAMNLGVLNATSRIATALTVLAGIFLFKEKPKKASYALIGIIIIVGIVLAFLSS